MLRKIYFEKGNVSKVNYVVVVVVFFFFGNYAEPCRYNFSNELSF